MRWVRWFGRAWTFYRDAFLRGFCTRIPLLGVLTLAVALGFGWVGAAFGVPLLFWHKDLGKQALVGVVLAFLVAGILLISYLIETRRKRLWRELLPPEPGVAVVFYSVGILLSFGVTGFVVREVLVWFGVLADQLNHFPPPNVGPVLPSDPMPFPGPLVAGVAVGLFVAALLVLVVPAVPAWRAVLNEGGRTILAVTKWVRLRLVGRKALTRSEELIDPPPAETHLHSVALLLFSASIVLFAALAWDEHGRWTSPAVSICLLLTAVTALYGFIAYHFPGGLAVVALLLALLLTVGGLPEHKYRIPGLEELYEAENRPGLDNRNAGATLIDVDTLPQPRRPLVVVCTSGGGIRAAGWTAAVLQQLEEAFAERGIDFPAHVRLITGASGGMVAAAYYVATLHPPAMTDRLVEYQLRPNGPRYKHRHSWRDQRNTNPLRPDEIVDGVMQDGLSSVVHRGVYGDLFQLFSPSPHTDDRGRALESAWSENMHRALDVPFQALREGEKAGWRPSLVFSPMLVEDGRRLLISNLDLEQVAQSQGNALLGGRARGKVLKEGQVFSRSAVELFRVLGDRPNFKLSTAARMSASFPLVSPAVGLPTAPSRRVVDAGYYDNYGVALAAAWLFTNHDWVMKHASGVVLIQIRDGVSESLRRLERPEVFPPPNPLARSLDGFLVPLEGVLTVREAAAAFRNDELLEQLSQTLRQTGRARNLRPDFFTTVTFEYGGHAALSWYLTEHEQDSIKKWAEQLRPAPSASADVKAARREAAVAAMRQNSPAVQAELREQSVRQETTIERLLAWWGGR